MDTTELYEKSFAQLKRDEGERKNKDGRHTVYMDSLSIPTIDYGINLREGLTDDEVELLFKHRWEKVLTELLGRAPWAGTLSEARLGALMNMAWNLGVPKLMGFTNMLLALRLGEWDKAKAHALNSIWSSQVGARAYRIAEQFRTGEWS